MTARSATVAVCAATVALRMASPATAGSLPGGAGQVMATDRFEYSYSSESQREIVENWLDASWLLGGLRAGVLLSHRSPSEEGERANTVRHRFVEFSAEGLDLRAGHFYGLFGRELLFAAQEDRNIRVDTALDGLWVQGTRGRLRGAAFTGTPAGRSIDVRGADLVTELGHGLSAGVSGLTWRADDFVAQDGGIHREWVAAPRLEAVLPFGGCYAEYGWKKGWDASVVPDDEHQLGQAFYAGVDLFDGPFGLSLEAEQQHVDLGGGIGFDLGAYNQQFLKVELGIAPTWAVAALFEVNDKFDEQRQAGYVCAGGICKFEPAFEGVELSGSLRY